VLIGKTLAKDKHVGAFDNGWRRQEGNTNAGRKEESACFCPPHFGTVRVFSIDCPAEVTLVNKI